MPDPAPASIPESAAKPAGGPPRKLSFRDALVEGSAGYKKIWPYIDKYRWRFIASIAAGAGSAALVFCQLKVIQMVTKYSFSSGTAEANGHVAAVPQKVLVPPTLVHHSFFGHVAFYGKEIAFFFKGLHHSLLGHSMVICSLLPLVIIARCLCDYLESYYMTWVSLKVMHDLRVKIFGHILSQSLDFFNKAKIGSLISRVSNDTRSAQLSISAVTDDIVTQPLTVITIIVYMFRTDWHFALYSLCFFPLCLLPITIFGRKVRKIGLQDESCNAELMVVLHEALAGIRLVKSLTREPYEEKRFTESSKYMIAVGMKVRKAMSIIGPIIESMGGFGVWAALVYVALSHMPFDKFTSLLASLVVLYTPVKKVSKVHISLQKALGATTKIFELLEVEPTIADSPDAVKLKRSLGDIQFDTVTFTYNLKLPPALKRISLHIEPGKSYALVGASGAGKSTIFSLLLRFYDPYLGVIRIDGHDLKTVAQKSLRDNLSIVSQDTFLFNTTIMENIRYGRLDATDEEVYEAARQAYAHDFILAQPHGYETNIGDKGCNISGGQQQRLAIARALLKNAPILLLDEATSALDSEAESEIQAALDRLSAGRTVIAIAHRLSTILKSDQIVVMEKGQIKDIGRHEELLEKSDLYRHFYNLQFKRHEAAVEEQFEVITPQALAS
ncbi:MAG: ABC transporter ATP-binding protein [Chthoniobacteraceae bacterium]|jgi:subfamily B ATP-binding cassette protein MsbA